MMKYKLWTINNKEEEKFLRKGTEKVKNVKDEKILKLIKDMREIMIKEKGVGLAANQIGIDAQIFVMGPGDDFFAFINPKITKYSKSLEEAEEGCLSVPGFSGVVPRSVAVEIKGYDENGKAVKKKFEGVFARICQHEYDHLSGVLFIDKATKVFKEE